MQIFSKPLSDRPTVFVEIIQRVGCEREVPGASRAAAAAGSIDCRCNLLRTAFAGHDVRHVLFYHAHVT